MNLENPKKRLLVGLILFIALVALCTYYAAENENHTKYPSYKAILYDYPEGEVVNVYGTVTQVSVDGFIIQENYRGHIITMKVLTGNSGLNNNSLTNENSLTNDNPKNNNNYQTNDNPQTNNNPITNHNPLTNNTVTLKDKVTIVGVLGPDNTIVSMERVEVNEYWKYIFLLARSFLALIFLVYIFNRYWRFDWENFAFRRR